MNHTSRWLGCLAAGSFLAISVQLAYAQLSVESVTPKIAQQADSTRANFSQHFQDLGVEGSIIIYDLSQDRTYQYNPERNASPFLPASTFKILNSMIALETGVIDSELDVLTWDGIERSFPAWNRDLNMENAFRVSAVWFYQVLARRIGYERMQQWVTDVGYGNQTIGDADAIDTFWLTGELRITPQAQIQFLRQLYDNDLPFSEAVMAKVKDIMIVEQTPNHTIRAKTGWATQSQTGWYVGYVEQGENVYFFATNIDIRSEADLPARADLTRRSLMTLELL